MATHLSDPTNPNLCVISKEMVTALWDLSPMQKRIISIAVTKFDKERFANLRNLPFDQSVQALTKTVSINEYVETAGIKRVNFDRDAFKDAVLDLASKTLYFEYNDFGKKSFSAVNWVSEAHFRTETGEATILFTPTVVQRGLLPQQTFIKYHLNDLFKFKGIASIKLFEELLLNRLSQNDRRSFIDVLSIEQLQRIFFGLDKAKYPENRFLISKKIKPAIAEIMKLGIADITYETIKAGRSITHLRFTGKFKKLSLSNKK